MTAQQIAARAARLAASLLVLAAASVGWPVPAEAVAPTNDVIDGAIAVEALPFSSSADTTEATAEGDGCANPAATVWYAFTPPADGNYDITTSGSDYDTTISVFAESPFLNLFSCGGVAMRQGLLGGETYYIQVGNQCCTYTDVGQVGPGGNLVLNISRSDPIEVSVAIDSTATLIRGDAFAVTVSGTIACNQDGLADLGGVLRQVQGSKVAQAEFSGGGTLTVPCSTTPTTWSRTVGGGDRRFLAKNAALTVTATACDAPYLLGCDSEVVAGDVTISR